MKDNMHSLKSTVARGMYDQLTSHVYQLQVPLPPDEETGWKSYPIFHGSTDVMHSFACHTSVLSPGQRPHPPHTHKEEEILLLLDGEVDLILEDVKTDKGIHRQRLRQGEFVYYPARFAHTLETVSGKPAHYLMYKWHNTHAGFGKPLTFGHFSINDAPRKSRDGFDTDLIFEGPTEYLKKLHCHFSTLSPGAGYDPHSDPYDVSIIMIEGAVETIGQTVEPHGVIYYRAGEPHGMYNPGDRSARYIVFEFHSNNSGRGDSIPVRLLIWFIKHAVPGRWRDKLRRILSRLGRFV